MSAKLTKAQAKALRWIAANEPVKWWPVYGGVSRQTRSRLIDAGLIAFAQPQPLALAEASITEAGRLALAEAGDE